MAKPERKKQLFSDRARVARGRNAVVKTPTFASDEEEPLDSPRLPWRFQFGVKSFFAVTAVLAIGMTIVGAGIRASQHDSGGPMMVVGLSLLAPFLAIGVYALWRRVTAGDVPNQDE